MSTASKHAVLTALSLIVGGALIWWVQPDTDEGKIFLVSSAVIVINAAGALLWRDKPAAPQPRDAAVWFIALLSTSLLNGCSSLPTGVAYTPAPVAAAYAPAPALMPTRNFLRPREIPPAGVGAYGMVALRTLPTDDESRQRLSMVCKSYLASLPSQDGLPANIAPQSQMVTIWPLDDPSAPQARANDCDYLLSHYALYAGISAINDAQDSRHRMEGRGPFLIGWSPAKSRGQKDSVVLVIDLSRYDRQASFDDQFRMWQKEIVEKPELWNHDFSIEHLRLQIKAFVDENGKDISKGLEFWKKQDEG